MVEHSITRKENGIGRCIYFPQKLDETIEVARKKLGMNRSRFITYAVIRFLQELSILTQTVHEEEPTATNG